MGNEIDRRIVEMEFNNKQFEPAAKATMSTLDKLKEKLNFSGASNGLENINNSAKKVTLSPISNAVDSIHVKFSALEVIATTALANITNSAINAGKRMVKAISEPLVEGGKRRSQNIEQAKFQLEGLGVAWNDIAEDINYGVKDTAYGLDVAAKAAAQFVASNIQIGDSMKTALRGISGVAAMTNSSYEDISNIFTAIAGNGRLMGDQLLQLSSRGINAAATLAKYIGITEAEFVI